MQRVSQRANVLETDAAGGLSEATLADSTRWRADRRRLASTLSSAMRRRDVMLDIRPRDGIPLKENRIQSLAGGIGFGLHHRLRIHSMIC